MRGHPALDPARDRVDDASPRVIPGAVYDASAEAARIVAGAREEAARIVEEARVLAERLRDEARSVGQRLGREEAAALVVAARARRDRALLELEPEVARLAVHAAERLIGASLAVDATQVMEVCGRVLEHARRASYVTLRVSPEDAAVVEGQSERLGALARVAAPIRVVADPAIARGGCLVQCDLGTIDGRLETQLAAFERALLAVARTDGAGARAGND
ncbi:MAG: flagellar assembly protein FliH [Deltaproteobacteria bacterium]|nr:flagellar assembly protein FliH [Deltaproteobacteria bacterium]